MPRFIVLIKANAQSEAGVAPSENADAHTN
jgi:hypothetical protein